MSLCPSHIHTHEHRSPVLALGAAGARVYLQHTVHRVFLLAQHVLQFQVLDGGDSLAIVLVNLLLGDHILVIEVERQLQFVSHLAHLMVSVNPSFYVLHLLHLHLRALRVVPEVGCLCAQFLLLIFHFLAVDVQIFVQVVGTLQHIFQLFCCNHNLGFTPRTSFLSPRHSSC